MCQKKKKIIIIFDFCHFGVGSSNGASGRKIANECSFNSGLLLGVKGLKLVVKAPWVLSSGRFRPDARGPSWEN